jgi:endonuclease YncB( thermonuclease family)
MKKLTILLLLLGSGLLATCGEESSPDCEPLSYDPLRQDPTREPLCYLDDEDCAGGDWVTIASVYDGDTVTLADDTKLRMLGIQAPEQPKGDGVAHPEADPETCLGPESGEFLRKLIEGKKVCVRDPEGGPQNDPYGRRLVYIYDGGFNINMYMVASGHACAFDKYAEPLCLNLLKTAEDEAEGYGFGVWGLCADLHGDPCQRAE